PPSPGSRAARSPSSGRTLRRTGCGPAASPSGGCPRLAGPQQPVTQLGLELGRGVKGARIRKLLEGGKPEEPQEQLGRAVQDGTELGAAALLHHPPLKQRGHRRLRV